MPWSRWPTADGPVGVLSEERPYYINTQGRVVVGKAAKSAQERTTRCRGRRRSPRGAPGALARIGEVWR
jgi:hypothetical protein